MNNDRELMQQALDALVSSRVFVTSREKIKHPEGTDWYDKRITALREALAQPEQEPVAWMYVNEDGECEQIEYGEPFDDPSVTPLYAAPPRESGCAECGKNSSEGWALYCVECSKPMREWVGLTDEEKIKLRYLVDWTVPLDIKKFADAIEAKLKEKNNG